MDLPIGVSPNSRKSRILLIDDDPLMRHIVSTALAKENYVVVMADSGTEGMDLAWEQRPDLILLDVMMPDADGFSVCYQLRHHTLTANVPIIMLTALGDINEKVRGMQMGADDYITKPFDPRELVSRVGAHLRRSARDLGSSPLTSLPGNPMIAQVLSARLEAQSPLAVLYIDMTHFKSYNDKYGWMRGDEIIRMLARQILDVALGQGGKDDFVGHIGGDDFVIITTPEHAEEMAQELIRQFDAAIPQYYAKEDQTRGYLEVSDRQGNPFRAPLATLAIGIVSNENRTLEHPSQVADLAAEVKAYVKTLPGSRYAFDRRRK